MALSQPTGVQSAQTANQAIAKAQYIDESPSLMVGTEDKTLYYFDPSSGTLSEMPINKNQTPVSVQDLKSILASQKINQGDIPRAKYDFDVTGHYARPDVFSLHVNETNTLPVVFSNT